MTSVKLLKFCADLALMSEVLKDNALLYLVKMLQKCNAGRDQKGYKNTLRDEQHALCLRRDADAEEENADDKD